MYQNAMNLQAAIAKIETGLEVQARSVVKDYLQAKGIEVSADPYQLYSKMYLAIVLTYEIEDFPDFDAAVGFVEGCIGDQGDDSGRTFLAGLATFNDLFDYLDASSAYDQADTECRLAEHCELLLIVYRMLQAKFDNQIEPA